MAKTPLKKDADTRVSRPHHPSISSCFVLLKRDANTLNRITFLFERAPTSTIKTPPRRLRFCDRDTHQFQARCPASRSRPHRPPGRLWEAGEVLLSGGPGRLVACTTCSHGGRGPAERSSPAWAETRAKARGSGARPCRPRTRARPEPCGRGAAPKCATASRPTWAPCQHQGSSLAVARRVQSTDMTVMI